MYVFLPTLISRSFLFFSPSFYSVTKKKKLSRLCYKNGIITIIHILIYATKLLSWRCLKILIFTHRPFLIFFSYRLDVRRFYTHSSRAYTYIYILCHSPYIHKFFIRCVRRKTLVRFVYFSYISTALLFNIFFFIFILFVFLISIFPSCSGVHLTPNHFSCNWKICLGYTLLSHHHSTKSITSFMVMCIWWSGSEYGANGELCVV